MKAIKKLLTYLLTGTVCSCMITSPIYADEPPVPRSSTSGTTVIVEPSETTPISEILETTASVSSEEEVASAEEIAENSTTEEWQEGVYLLSFDSCGGSEITTQAVYAGETAIRPEDPIRTGYVFVDWYVDAEYTEAYDFTQPINADLTLYAAWMEADVQITLTVDTEEPTISVRKVSGTVTSNLAIKTARYELAGAYREVEEEITLAEDGSFEATVSLEDGENTFTAIVNTIDGSEFEAEITMVYESGEVVDYEDTSDVYDPEDPRVVTKPVDDPDSTTVFVTNILNLFFTEDSTYAEREEFIATALNGKTAGSLNSVEMMQAWLPEELVPMEGYEGTTILADITEEELNDYAEAVAAAYDEIDDAYIDYIYDDAIEVTDNDPWTGNLDPANDSLFDESTFSGNEWWRDYVNFPEAWDYDSTNGFDYLVNTTLGVVDSGFNLDHTELDTVSVISKTKTPDEHGTHVAGIITAEPNNSEGFSGGMYGNSSLLGYDVSKNNRDISDSQIYSGLVKCVETGAKVVNFSIGSSGSTTDPDQKTEKKINKEGKTASQYVGRLLRDSYDFVVVQSAGNAGIDSVNNGSFACISAANCASVDGVTTEDITNRILIVSAVQNDDSLTYFSCGGASGTHAIAAPGLDIFSCGTGTDDYAYMSGTSMAAPIVTAVCGLVFSANPYLTGADVVRIVEQAATVTANQSANNTNTTGGMGIVNAEAAVEEAIAELPQYHFTAVNAVTGDPIEVTYKIYPVTLSGANRSYETEYVSDSNGVGTLPKLPWKKYTIEVSAEGYISSYMTFRMQKTDINSEVNLGTIALTPVLNEDEYRIILRWTSEPRDLDSHLRATDAEGNDLHIYYRNMSSESSITKLDRDDRDYEGPETITIYDLSSLRNVRYAVHDYTNRSRSLSSALSTSGAFVEVYKGSQLLQSFEVPFFKTGTVWEVFAFDAEGNIIPINQMTTCEDPSKVLQTA